MYKWLVDTRFGRAGTQFHVTKFRHPYIITSFGLKVFNPDTGEFDAYIKTVDYDDKDFIFEKDHLQLKMEF